jgi:ankyrin repeat protein
MDIFEASRTGNLERVRELLAQGVDVNEEDYYTDFTALMLASENGHLPIVRELIAQGADVRVPDYIDFAVMPDTGTLFHVKSAWLGHFLGVIGFAPIPLPPIS